MSQHLTELFRTNCGASAPLELTVSRPGWASSERHVFEHPFALIGRQEHSCLRLEDGRVSRRHAYLQQLGGRVFCVDLGSRTGIRWGGELRPAGWLRPEQGVQIGPFTLEPGRAVEGGQSKDDHGTGKSDPLQDRANDSAFLPRITVEVGNDIVSRLCMNRTLLLVGSAPNCRVRLRDARISRYHCSLVRTPQGVWLIDLLSDSSTRVNGQALPWGLVQQGDRLQVGPFVLRIWYPNGSMQTPSSGRVEVPAEMSLQSLDRPSETVPQLPPQQSAIFSDAMEAAGMVSALRAELEQARERQLEAEILRQQLTDSQTENERLREEVGVLKVRVADAAELQARLEAVQASAGELEAVRLDRQRWQSEAQELKVRVAALSDERDQLSRLGADLDAAQMELERLDSEHKASRQSAEQALGRVADLERALTEAVVNQATALEESRTVWESERQALATRLETQSHNHDAAIREGQIRAAAEREEWQQRLEATQQQLAEEREEARQTATRLEQESAVVHQVRADLAAQSAAHDAALQQLQQTQDERTLAHDTIRCLQTDLDLAHQHQRDVEILRQQLSDSQAESDQLREQVGALEVQVAETAGLQAQLEAAQARAGELEAVRRERDRWHAEAQEIEARLTTLSAEREEWQQRLAASLQQLAEERETIRNVEMRLEDQSAVLRQVQADLAARNVEHEAALHQLREAQEKIVLNDDAIGKLQAELTQARERQRDAEVFRQQLENVRAEHAQLRTRVPELEERASSVDRLGERIRAAGAETEQLRVQLSAAEARGNELEQVRSERDRLHVHVGILEVQVAKTIDMEARLEAAQANAGELEAVRLDRQRWQSEAQELKVRVAALSDERDQLSRLGADLHAAQMELERLEGEHKASRQSAEQALGRVADLERALTEAVVNQATALEESRTVWESERQALATRLETQSHNHDAAIREGQIRAAAEREEWQQRLEATQQQLAEEREEARQAVTRLEQESAVLQQVRADLAARSVEHNAALQQLQQTQDERTLAHDTIRYLQRDLDQARHRRHDAEILRQQLNDSQAESDRLREQVGALEVQVAETAGLQARLEAAQASAGELETVRRERDRWHAEAQEIEARLTTVSAEAEQLTRLVRDLHAAQEEQQRLHSEHKVSRQSDEQASNRVADLERALTEAAAAQSSALEEARAAWESERQALATRLEIQGQNQLAAIREIQARAAAEREEWRQRLQGAEMQLVWERGMFQEQGEQIRQQAARLQAERDQLAARLSQTELKLQAAEKRTLAEVAAPAEAASPADLQQLKQLAARELVFVQLSAMRPGQLSQQTARAPRSDLPVEQVRSPASFVREGILAEEQGRLSAIAQEVQAAWGETPIRQERPPAIGSLPGRGGEQVSEGALAGGGEKADERRGPSAALSAISSKALETSKGSETPCDLSAAPGESPADGDASKCFPQRKPSSSDARTSFWRQIVNRVLGT